MSSESHLTFKLATWCKLIDCALLPSDVLEVARHGLLDGIGTAVAGSSRSEARHVRTMAETWYREGACTVIGGDRKLSAPGAALCNAMAMHCLDFDDTHYEGIVHPTAVTLPAAMACSEVGGSTEGDLFSAYIAGLEAACTIGRMATDELYYRGFFTTSVIGSSAAAVSAARALNLGHAETRQAVGIAAAQAGGLRASLGTTTKPFLAARACEQGVQAALMAKDGFEGPCDVFEEPRGFFATLNDGVAEWSEAGSLGQQFSIVDPGLLFKRYPVCSAALAATEATDDLLREYGASGEDVISVSCEVPRLVAISLTHESPTTAQEAQFSMQFAVGAILTSGRLDVSMLESKSIAEVQRWEAKKVSMYQAHDDGFHGCPEGARVIVRFCDGEEATRFRCAATGYKELFGRKGPLEKKFLECVGTTEAADSLLGVVRDFPHARGGGSKLIALMSNCAGRSAE